MANSLEQLANEIQGGVDLIAAGPHERDLTNLSETELQELANHPTAQSFTLPQYLEERIIKLRKTLGNMRDSGKPPPGEKYACLDGLRAKLKLAQMRQHGKSFLDNSLKAVKANQEVGGVWSPMQHPAQCMHCTCAGHHASVLHGKHALWFM
jgi:hypothetical protein